MTDQSTDSTAKGSGPVQAPLLPELPYAGTSGWSGSDASRERAQREDTDGTTSQRQYEVIVALRRAGHDGMTWQELSAAKGWHHGQASGILSGLHLAGRVARLREERRNRCSVYVDPEYVGDRPTAMHGRKVSALTVTEGQAAARTRLRYSAAVAAAQRDGSQPSEVIRDLGVVLDALDRLTAKTPLPRSKEFS